MSILYRHLMIVLASSSFLACSDIQSIDDTADAGCSENCDAPNNTLCGNNILDEGEGCDDGNRISGDGCNIVCEKEEDGPKVPPTANKECGNGKIDIGETCDFTATLECKTTCDSNSEKTGTQSCSTDTCQLLECNLPVETCNGRDDDCDGEVDEGCFENVYLCGSNVSVNNEPLSDAWNIFAVDHGYVLESELDANFAVPGYNCTKDVSWKIYKEQVPGTIPLYRAKKATDFTLSTDLKEISTLGYTKDRILGYALAEGATNPLVTATQALDRYARNQEPWDGWCYGALSDQQLIDFNYRRLPFTIPVRVWDLVTLK